MRLLTHNMLSSNIKGVTNGFPLKIEPEKVIQKQVDFNPDFLKNMFSKIDWKALAEGAKIMGYDELPDEVPDQTVVESDEFLRKFHHALLEIHLEEGALVCPETGRRFPVNKGIPNMLLHEDEQKVSYEMSRDELGISPENRQIWVPVVRTENAWYGAAPK